MARIVAGTETGPVYRLPSGGSNTPPVISIVPPGTPGATPGSGSSGATPLYRANPGMQEIAQAAMRNPEQLPAMPTMLAIVDAYANKIPWWIVLGAGLGAGWWVSGYISRRRATVVAGE